MLDKAIASGKEHRKMYYGSKAADRTCRCHGSCLWCRENRLANTKRRNEKAAYSLAEMAV